MSIKKSRIPRKIKEFDDYISATDDRQLAIDPATTNPYYKGYGWTPAESAAWTAFRTTSNGLYAKYKEKTTLRTTQIKDDALLNIKACIKYDNDPTTGHHLLNAVAEHGTTTDWLIFNVKKDTALQDTTRTASAATGTKKPQIAVTEISHLGHKITFTNLDAPKSKAKPDGIKDIHLYYAIMPDDITEPKDSDYQYYDDFRRGHVVVNFDGTHIKKTAWYKARYENTKGEKGEFCDPVKGTII